MKGDCRRSKRRGAHEHRKFDKKEKIIKFMKENKMSIKGRSFEDLLYRTANRLFYSLIDKKFGQFRR